MTFSEIERKYQILFFDIPITGVLNNLWITKFHNNKSYFIRNNQFLIKILIIKNWLFPKTNKQVLNTPNNSVLFAMTDESNRIIELMLPIIHEFKEFERSVICGKDGIKKAIPDGVFTVPWNQCLSYSTHDWRKLYSQYRKQWLLEIKKICTTCCLPKGAQEELLLGLMIASQYIIGSLAFLSLTKPKVIITDYDRNSKWSCLVIAARMLSIPTVTLTHGVMSGDACGYSPVLADRIISWGEIDCEKLIRSGESPDKIIIGGCPRLSRDILQNPEICRSKMGLATDKSVVMYASSPERLRVEYVEAFCIAVENINEYVAFVRLHPAEKLGTYENIMKKYPKVRFYENNIASLDECLAASNVVVTHGSGVGSDALVKRRMTVVIDFDLNPTGHGADLVTLAGCPHARTPNELAEVLGLIMSNRSVKEMMSRKAEFFVKKFCVAYGDDSANKIANSIKNYIYRMS